MKICDIHSHTLQGVDHGAKDLDTALQMLSNAVASDVEYLMLTPHFDLSDCSADALWTQMHHLYYQN